MARTPKRPSKDPAPGSTPLDAKQRALAEEEAKLHQKIERLGKFVEDAPKLAAERARLEREEMLRRAASPHSRTGPTSLMDRRTTLEANVATAKERHLRSVRRQGRLTFFVLLLALAGAIFYFYYTVSHG